MKIERLPFATILLLLGPTLLVGCVHNVATDPRYPTDYRVGAVYRFKEPVYAEDSGGLFIKYYILHKLPPGETIEAYEKKAQDAEMYPSYDPRWSNVAGVVKPGDLVRIISIQTEENPADDHAMWVKGDLIGPRWAKHPAELSFISQRVPNPGLFGGVKRVDTNIIERLRP